MPRESKDIDYNSELYHLERHKPLIDSYELRLAWSHFADNAYFQEVKSGMRVLEFGGGLGNNLLTVKSRADAWMVEPSAYAVNIAVADGIQAVQNMQEIPYDSFDFILCRHVLEHLENPLGALEMLRSYLKPDGGRLITVVPCESCKEMPKQPELNYHLFCWNPRTLSNLLSRAGMEVTSIRFEHYGARRKLLPVFRAFGGKTYARLVRLVGRIFSFRELLVESVPMCL